MSIQTIRRWHLILTSSKTEAAAIHEMANNLNPNIKFTIEHENEENGELSLLDFTVKINNNGIAKYNFYTKTAKKPIFINYKSALPNTAKKTI